MIKANIGDAHAMGQQPITFIRQVVSAVAMPSLLESANIPSDVKEHASNLLKACGGGSAGTATALKGVYSRFQSQVHTARARASISFGSTLRSSSRSAMVFLPTGRTSACPEVLRSRFEYGLLVSIPSRACALRTSSSYS